MCDIESDGLEIVKPGNPCPNAIHDFIPFLNDDERVAGLVCQACDHRVHEDATSGSYSVTASGNVVARIAMRKDL